MTLVRPASASYDAISDHYDATYSTAHEAAENRLLASLMKKWRMFNLPPGPATTEREIPVTASGTYDQRHNTETVRYRQFLDVGCGTGLAIELSRLAERPIPPERYLGIDPSAGMIRQARKKFDCTFVLGKAETMYQWGQFDRIAALFGPFNYADPDKSFDALARASRPGTIVFMVVYTPIYQQSPKYILSEAPPFANFFTANQLRRRLQGVGFQVQDIVGMSSPDFYTQTGTPLQLKSKLKYHLRTTGRSDPDASCFIIARARKV